MKSDSPLLIIGASARAAAFSALRAGLRPWCADLFADADLRAHCEAIEVRHDHYPHQLASIIQRGPAGPWMYTGALENRPALLQSIAQDRPLWGNDADVLKRARSPWHVAGLLARAGIPCPEVRNIEERVPVGKRWLIKPLASAGGGGIRPWKELRGAVRRECYLQEFIEGEPCAAVYVGDNVKARLLGVTWQLTGEPWLHAARFHYCGSIGPMPLDLTLLSPFARLGDVLAAGCGLRGLFGVDCVLRDGTPWPVEINPRYTASVEVLEHALGVSALARHRRSFDPNAPADPALTPLTPGVIGKAVLFARAPLIFPADGPWTPTLRRRSTPSELPTFADIPRAGSSIKAGRPILTFFARADSVATCRDALRQTAKDLDHWLFA